jgi:hypothetical protein
VLRGVRLVSESRFMAIEPVFAVDQVLFPLSIMHAINFVACSGLIAQTRYDQNYSSQNVACTGWASQ